MRRRWQERYADAAVVWLNACLLFLLLNVAVALVHRSTRPAVLEPNPAALARAHPHLDAQAVDQLIVETSRPLAYEPYTDMTDPPARGRFVNVDAAGFRHSAEQGPWPPDGRHHNVFLFGGSTTFGYGVTDAYTIASYLQPLLPAPGGRRTFVYNFGHSGYYSTQERILFERLVVAGHRPAAAVFIDGFNDFVAVDDRPRTAAHLENAYRRLAEPPLRTAVNLLPIMVTVRHAGRALGIVQPAPSVDPEPIDGPDGVRAVLERYRRSKTTVAAVGAAHGVRTMFVWQPVPMYRFPPREGTATVGVNRWMRQGYETMQSAAAAGELGDDFVWCADVAADGTEDFYVDFMHYAPVLSERVARCIAGGLSRRGGSAPPLARPGAVP